MPHFCFDCGCLVHQEVKCQASEDDGKKWGEWPRASPRKNKKPPPPARPSVSVGSYSSRSAGSEVRYNGGVSIRDLPTRRNLARDYSYSSSSRTGGSVLRRGDGDVTSPDKRHEVRLSDRDTGKKPVDTAPKKNKTGTFVRKPRNDGRAGQVDRSQMPPGNQNKKRGSKQVWMPVQVQIVGEGSSESAGKRQRTTSVFDRLPDPAADPAAQGRRYQ